MRRTALKLGLAFAGASLGVMASAAMGANKAPAQAVVPDGAPSGMIAYFADGEGCPTGWEESTRLRGRIPVGVFDDDFLGVAVGEPLADREDRTHTHRYTVEITLPPNDIAGANGDNKGAKAGVHSETFVTGASTSGLPFVQLRSCVKQ